MKLNIALEQFAEWGSMKYAPSTVSTYTGLIGRFVELYKSKDVDEIDVMDITAYYGRLRSQKYHDSSIAFMMISLRQFFKYLCLRRLTAFNYELIQIPKYVSNSFPPASREDAAAMMNNITGDSFKDLRNRAILSFLFSSGVRVSELCDIKVSDLVIDRNYGNIVSKKNRKKAMVFWDETTARIFDKYLPEREGVATTDYLFVSLAKRNRGGKLSTRSVERFIRSYRTAPRITPHSFRHGLGMRAVQANLHPRYIQKILRHRNLNSSQVYMDVYDGDVVDAYKKIT